MVDKVIFAVMRMSSTNGGKGMTIAIRIPKTAIGTTSSHGASFSQPEANRSLESDLAFPAMGALWPVAAVRLTVAGLETTGAVMTIGPSIFHRYRFLLSNRKT